MTTPDQPQLYLITPPSFDLSVFPDQLGVILDEVEIACLRIDLATQDEDEVVRAADILREVCHTRDVAVVISDHVVLAERLGLDGVHLSDAARSVRGARKTLGPDAIVGCFCGTSRHDGLTAGEAGADYVSFGPVGDSALNAGDVAETDLFQWWSEVIEVPVVAEGALGDSEIKTLREATDFFAFREEIWRSENPLARLNTIQESLR